MNWHADPNHEQTKRELGIDEHGSRKPYVVFSERDHHQLQAKVIFAMHNGYMVQGGVTSDKGVLYQAVVDARTLHNPQPIGVDDQLLIEWGL